MRFCLARLLIALALAMPSVALAGTVEDIKSTGVITCGLEVNRPGFSVRAADYKWVGFDVDLCRALAAAVLGDPQKVNLTAVSTDEAIVVLQSGEVDVLMHGLAWTQGADARHGLMFVVPTFPGPPIYGPMVRQGDDQWFHVVRNVVFALMSTSAASGPAVDDALLLTPGWQARAVAAAGNYADMFARHFGPSTSFMLTPELPGAWLPPAE